MSTILLDNGPSLEKTQKRLSAEAFFVPANRLIYQKCCSFFEARKSLPIEELAEEMARDGSLAQVGGVPYLHQVSARVPTTAKVDYFIDRVHELWQLRTAISEATSFVEKCFDYQGEDGGVASLAGPLTDRLQNLARFSRSGAALPPIMSWDEFAETPRQTPAELVAGVLHKGAKLMVGGGSKSFKTWVLLDLGLSVATGTPWWGMRTEPGDVLYVNYELAVEFCQIRVKDIAAAKGIKTAPRFHSWHLRGHASDLKDQLAHFVTQTGGLKYSLIILDPIYKCLGDRDENANGEVAELLNIVESLTVKTGAAVAFGHHFSKGNQSEKSAMDRVSGAGAWARDPDALITLTPHEEESCFVVDYTLRNIKPRESQVVRWEHPCMRTADGLDPAALKKAGRPKEHAPRDLVNILKGGPLIYSKILIAAKQKGISESSTKRLLKHCTSTDLIEKIGDQYYAKQ